MAQEDAACFLAESHWRDVEVMQDRERDRLIIEDDDEPIKKNKKPPPSTKAPAK